MGDPLATLRAASERRAASQEAERDASRAFLAALQAAKSAGVPEKALEDATGLTRQRIWQLLKS